MTAKRIPQLDAITGANTANDDNLVIYDTSEGTTKRILRSQLAAGLAVDLPYTPSGGIAATTVLTAIAELDTEAAKSVTLAAAGGAALIGNTPAGAIVATTVQDAINELDTEAAKIGTAQTFTAQQTLTSGLVIQTLIATDIASIANAINTTNKVTGKVVYDTTNNRIMVASGALADSPWYIADGSASVTPA